ncbi:zinc ribbon domain-containing protein [Azotosporobacter soli]|uniref:FmdB family zinc ribbon protein n=1 Tax=Azotosporobacter soli TaxID=3055040 RepID=UPI0031FF0834
MPLYEYSCEQCGAVVELLQKMGTTEAGVPCPSCQGERLKKKLSVSAPARQAEGGAPCGSASSAPHGCSGCCGSCQ